MKYFNLTINHENLPYEFSLQLFTSCFQISCKVLYKIFQKWFKKYLKKQFKKYFIKYFKNIL